MKELIVHTIHARHMLVAPVLAISSDLEPEKLKGLVDFIQRGGRVPPVVAARYGETLMPLDGAYRIAAHAELGKEVDAWLISGTSYDKLCDLTNRPEDYIICGTVPAMEVADGSGLPDVKSTRDLPGKLPAEGRSGVAVEPDMAADLINTEFRTTWWD
jgi:hypothetical protein